MQHAQGVSEVERVVRKGQRVNAGHMEAYVGLLCKVCACDGKRLRARVDQMQTRHPGATSAAQRPLPHPMSAPTPPPAGRRSQQKMLKYSANTR